MVKAKRRSVLKLAGSTALGGMAGILATGRTPAYAQQKTVHWLKWVDFVPATDQMFRKEMVPAAEKALGMKVLGLKRHAAHETDAFAQQIFFPNELLRMITLSDYLVVAAPLTAETRGMIGKAELAAMKRTAVLINLGRGPIIEEGELVRVLAEKSIRGAALDVFDEEPLPKGHPFYRLDNVLLSPHCADHTPDWLDNATLFFADQFERYERNEKLRNLVDKSLGY